MRVTNTMSMNAMRLYLSQNMNALNRLQQMLGSGSRINKPSDDPIGIISSMRFSTGITETEEYISKIDEATNFMDTTDSSLNNVESILHRVRELTVNAASDTNDVDSRAALAREISELKEQLAMVANTTYGSKSIFGGTNVTNQPYDQSRDLWIGNNSQMQLEISAGVKLTINNNNLSEFFYNTGTTIQGNSVDLSRITSHEMLAGKRFSLVLDDLNKSQVIVTIDESLDIDPTGWDPTQPGQRPSHEQFINILKSAFQSQGKTLEYTNGEFRVDGKVETIEIDGQPITNLDNFLSDIKDHIDLQGHIVSTESQGYTTYGQLTFITPPSVTTANLAGVVNDNLVPGSTLIRQAVTVGTDTTYQWQLTTAGPTTTSGVIQIYKEVSPGPPPVMDIQEIDANDTTWNMNDTDLNGYSFAFKPGYSITEHNIEASGDWGAAPTSNQYKMIMQSAIERAVSGKKINGEVLTGKVMVEGNATDGFSIRLVDSSLTTDGTNPSHYKIRAIGDEDIGPITDKDLTIDNINLSQIILASYQQTGALNDVDEAGLQNLILSRFREVNNQADWGKLTVAGTSFEYGGFPCTVNIGGYDINTTTDLTDYVTDHPGLTLSQLYNQNITITSNAGTEVIETKISSSCLNRLQYDGINDIFTFNGQVCDVTLDDGSGTSQTINASLKLSDYIESLPADNLETLEGFTIDITDSLGVPVCSDTVDRAMLLQGVLSAKAARLPIAWDVRWDSTSNTWGIDGGASGYGVSGKMWIGNNDTGNLTSFVSMPNNWPLSNLKGMEVTFKPTNTSMTLSNVSYIDATSRESVQENVAGLFLGGKPGQNFVRYTDNDAGVIQIIDRIVTDIYSGDHDAISTALGYLDDKMNMLNKERSIIGARINRIDLQKERLENTKISYTSLLSYYQDADMTQVIMDLKMKENTYQASLAAGARIIQPSLMDFLK
ncbi:MAG: flagellar hook-associated protein FlgL [Methylocystaceae bacterium]